VNIVSFIRTAAPAMRSRATGAVATCRNDPSDNVTKVCCLVEQALTAATIADCIDRLRGDRVGSVTLSTPTEKETIPLLGDSK